MAYTSECFQCKPGTYSAKPGSAHCSPCPAQTYSNKGATVCLQCDQDKYSGMYIYISKALSTTTKYIIESATLLLSLSFAFAMDTNTHANAACTAEVHAACFRLSLGYNVSCVLSLIPAGCFSLTWFFFFPQRLVQGAANQDLRVRTVTTSTPTLPVTLRDR